MNDNLIRRKFLIGAAGAAFTKHTWAQENNYPSRPIQMVVPYPPAGTTDALARLIGKNLASTFGQPVVIENKPGAGGNMGAAEVARAKPDGHTLMLTTNALIINPHIYGSMAFDPLKAFSPIAILGQNLMAIVVNPSLPASTVSELITYLKQNPGREGYASSGVGSPHHLAGEMFKQIAGVDMVHVPYKGGPPAVTDTVGGQVKIGFLSIANAWPFINGGQLRAIAMLENERASVLPDIPAVGETIKGFAVSAWIGIFAPAGTSKDIIAKINNEANRIVNLPGNKGFFQAQGIQVVTGTPEDFSSRIQNDYESWGKVTKTINLKLN